MVLPTVTIVAASRETRDRMSRYLERAGLRTQAVSKMDRALYRHPPRTAVVVFPDELSLVGVLQGIARLHKARPRLVSLIVTRQPSRFASLSAARTAILPKPAWGWSILEAIQQLEAGP